MGRQGARREGRGGIDRRIAFVVLTTAVLLALLAAWLFTRPANGNPVGLLKPDTVSGCTDRLTEILRAEEEIGDTPAECDGLSEADQHEAAGEAFSRVATEVFEREMAKLGE